MAPRALIGRLAAQIRAGVEWWREVDRAIDQAIAHARDDEQRRQLGGLTNAEIDRLPDR